MSPFPLNVTTKSKIHYMDYSKLTETGQGSLDIVAAQSRGSSMLHMTLMVTATVLISKDLKFTAIPVLSTELIAMVQKQNVQNQFQINMTEGI